MDAISLSIYAAAALVGWAVASPLLRWTRHLLATVTAQEAAPVAYSPHEANALAITTPMPLKLNLGWEWIFRVALSIGVPVALWRAQRPMSIFAPAHLLVALDCAILAICLTALILIAVIDGATHLVFTEIVAPPAVLLLVVGAIEGMPTLIPMLIGGALAGGAFWLLYAFGKWRYNAEALGFGDVQLAAAFGIILGWQVVLSAIVFGLLLFALVTGALLATRRITTQTYMPIGTFLAIGAIMGLIVIPPFWF